MNDKQKRAVERAIDLVGPALRDLEDMPKDLTGRELAQAFDDICSQLTDANMILGNTEIEGA